MLSSQYHDWMKSLLDKLKEQQFAYLIERKANNKNYYFFDVGGIDPVTFQAKDTQIVWTPFQRNAALFDTEEQVEEFKSSYINPRKASIVRIVKPPSVIVMMYG